MHADQRSEPVAILCIYCDRHASHDLAAVTNNGLRPVCTVHADYIRTQTIGGWKVDP